MERIAVICKGSEWSLLPLCQSLGRKGYQIYCFYQSGERYSIHSKYISGKTKIPSVLKISNLEQIKFLCYKLSIKKLICLSDEIKYLISQNRNHFSNLDMALPSVFNFEKAFFKDQTMLVAKSCGVPIPKTFFVESSENLPVLDFGKDKLFVVKGISGSGSERVAYAKNQEQLITEYAKIYDIEEKDEFCKAPPFIQQYVGGPTYLSQAIVNNGEVLTVIPHKKKREIPVTGGITTRASTIESQRITKYMKIILEKLNWHGEVGMEWKYDEHRKDYVLLEINPRFEGSLDIAIKSEVDLPKLLIKLLEKNIENKWHNHKKDTHYRWIHWELKHLFETKDNLLDFILESFNPKINSELSFDDLNILPKYIRSFFIEFKNQLKN